MDFAVIKLAGKQYVVSPSQKLTVEADVAEGKKELVLTDVLLTSLNNKLTVGTPLVGNARVVARVLSTGKGEKVRVAKFKAKSRFRRANGFRPNITVLEIESVGAEQKADKPSEKEPVEKKTRKQK